MILYEGIRQRYYGDQLYWDVWNAQSLSSTMI